MSQPTRKTAKDRGKDDVSASSGRIIYTTYVKDCAVLFGDRGPVIASGKALGKPSRISATILALKTPDSDPWFGFELDFPLGKDQVANEASGFGVRHALDRSVEEGRILPLDKHRISFKFPRRQHQTNFEDAPSSVVSRFPRAKAKGLTYVSVHLQDEAQIKLNGFGVPFANSGDPEVEGWVKNNEPIVEGHTILDLLAQREFFFVVGDPLDDAINNFNEDRLPPPFMYPFGTDQTWDVNRIKAIQAKNKGHKYAAAYGFDDDNSHMTAINQGNTQDVMWLDDAATQISSTKFPVYFVRPASGSAADARALYAVIALTKDFKEQHKVAWRRLTKNDIFVLWLFNDHEDEKATEWNCRIINHPANIDILSEHPIGKHELVLSVRRPPPGKKRPLYVVKDFNDCKRRVNAVSIFDPEASKTCEVQCSEDELEDRMELHRALVRGTGFDKWMTKTKPKTTEEDIVEDLGAVSLRDAPRTMRALPSVDFLDFNDEAYANIIVEEALPQDRARFRGYLSNRPLGLGLIAAGPGLGKTTAGAAATLAMEAKFGKILCSAPTHVAVDNFASRLYKRACVVVDRYNEGKQQDDPTRRQHKIVVRAYKFADEVKAFHNLLQNPQSGDDAAPKGHWQVLSRWKMHLSLAYWLLVVLRSSAVRELQDDDSKALHEIQSNVDKRNDLRPLRAVVTGDITFTEFKNTFRNSEEVIEDLMYQVLRAADMVCTTPAATVNNKEYLAWKSNLARGVAVDEAANMNRADLYCVWGNTLLPCFLIGDPKQLPPTVMTEMEKDAAGNFFNRFANDGKISPLLFFQGVGIPVYRLKTQLRMAKGMFQMMAKIIYPGIPFDYADSCAISLPQFKVGRDLEDFIQETYPEVKPAPAGELHPVFVHCQGSRVSVNRLSRSKRCPDQVTIALNFLAAFVKAKKVDPTKIVIIAPYAANVEVIKRLRKHPDYKVLAGMPAASTVDSFQGQENDITCVVMGTTGPKPGPGFTSNEQRLNVSLTRSRAGLVIVGDINVTGRIDTEDFKDQDKGKGKGEGKTDKPEEDGFLAQGANEEKYRTRATALRDMHKVMYAGGRVLTIPVECKKKGPAPPPSTS